MANDQQPYENITRVFWIKIELKDIPWTGKQDIGEIKDVISGIRSPLRNPLDIVEFIVPYMKQMGIPVTWFLQFVIWFNKMKSRKYAHGSTLDRRAGR